MTGRIRTGVVVAVTAAASLTGGALLTSAALRAADESRRADRAVAAVEELCAQVRALGGLCLVDTDQLRSDAGPAGPGASAGPAEAAAADCPRSWQLTRLVVLTAGGADQMIVTCIPIQPEEIARVVG